MQASVPAKSAAQSSRVRVRKIAVSSAFSAGQVAGDMRSGKRCASRPSLSHITAKNCGSIGPTESQRPSEQA